VITQITHLAPQQLSSSAATSQSHSALVIDFCFSALHTSQTSASVSSGLMVVAGPGEQFDERYVRKEVKHGGGNVMVWGCVTAIGMGCIVKINGNMDGPLYTKILKDDVLGTLKELSIKKKNIYFQQDNDPKYTSKVAQKWFKKNKLDVLDWAQSSPDMSIIEHVWEYLDRRVCTQSPLPTN
jgi:hypothetical protein